MIDFTFQGDRNFAPKYATATVDLTQTGHAGQQVVTHKAFTSFRFGDDGVEHKAIFLENATCAPLTISVHAGKTEKQAQLDFSCTEVGRRTEPEGGVSPSSSDGALRRA